MGKLKISPDLFLGVAELNRFQKFLDNDGYRKNILDNTSSFGLIKNSRDLTFQNGRVERDLDTELGQRTIKVRELFGIDKFGQFIYKSAQSAIPVPNDGNWYWVKVAYAVSNIEKGTFSISGNGDLIDTSGSSELLTILRGMPNFPSRIKFTNSQYNTLEYDVLEVIDNTHATIQQPATNSNGISEFVPETGLKLKLVGTFTQGVAVPNASKNPFEYDSATISLVLENFTNSKPLPYVVNQEFYIARVKATDSTVLIQDKRTEYWETKGSSLNYEITRVPNACVGIESIQFNGELSASDKNIVKLSWGMRSSNWSIDSSNNIVTFSSGLGGKFKSVNDFTNGDFNGWRLYTPSGKYSKIVSSVKQGSAINFTLDVLDVDNFSSDGGTTLISGFLMAVPDCDSVEIQFTPDPTDNMSAYQESFVFPVNELIGRCDVLVYKDPNVLYNVKYRLKSLKEFTEFKAIPSDTVNGYYTEASFDANGNLKTSDQRVYYTYTSSETAGFIQLQIASNAISKFRDRVDKGDLIGVTNIASFDTLNIIDLIVGTNKNYIFVNGEVTLPNDIYFNLNRSAAIEGNEFKIHINCDVLDLAGHSIFIVEDFGLGTQQTLKEITLGDVYQMQNQDGGLIFKMKFNGSNWVLSQNYDLGRPYEVIQIDGVISSLFDAGTGLGKVKGLYGYVICNEARTINGISVPNLTKRFLIGSNQGETGFNVGNTGGAEEQTLDITNMPSHKHRGGTVDDSDDHFVYGAVDTTATERAFSGVNAGIDGETGSTAKQGYTSYEGGDQSGIPVAERTFTEAPTAPFSILNPYYSLIFAKKIF